MIDTKLITFLTLLEEKSYTKTASRLYITQPAVTHHIKSLEKDYEIILFENQKTFELTKSGMMLYEYAKNLKLQDELLISNLKKQNTFLCDIGFSPMVEASLPVAHVLQEYFQEKIPSFNAYCYSNEEIIYKLSTGELDFGFVDCVFDSSIFESVALITEKIVVVGKPDGQYKGKDRITREQLAVATIIMPDNTSGIQSTVQSVLKSKNIKLKNNYFLSTNTYSLMKSLVLLTDGLSFAYYDCAKNDLESGVLKKYDVLNFQASQTFSLIYNRLLSPDEKMKEFIDLVSKKASR